MKERPILMHARSIKGILEGRKTQTRRIVKSQPPSGWDRHCWFDAPLYGWTLEPELAQEWHKVRCPYIGDEGLNGDRLWVRETWRLGKMRGLMYRADYTAADSPEMLKWRPSIFMPRAASRLTLEITDIRVEQVQYISESDCRAEGLVRSEHGWYGGSGSVTDPGNYFHVARNAFGHLWNETNGKGAWDRNDWVWAISFKVVPS